MWVLRTCVDFELLEHLTAELALRHHALYSVEDDLFRLLGSHFAESSFLESARITAVSLVDLVSFLLACHSYLLGVDDYYVVACVDMRCVDRLFLSSQDHCCLNGELSESLAFSIDHIPFALDVRRLCDVRFHLVSFLPTGFCLCALRPDDRYPCLDAELFRSAYSVITEITNSSHYCFGMTSNKLLTSQLPTLWSAAI